MLAAVAAARARQCQVVAFTGETGGELGKVADLLIAAPSRVTARIQEVHGLCIHVICESLDQKIRAGDGE